MTRMVTEKALALLTQSVKDIVGEEADIANALVKAIHTGATMDLIMAKASFETLDTNTRQEIMGQAVSLASTATVH